MNNKREEAPPTDLKPLAAAFQAVDRELGALISAQASGQTANAARFEEARALLRRAIQILTPEASGETAAQTVSAKRRVKIKAESEIAGTNDAARTSVKAAAGAAAKPSRGGRTGRRATATETELRVSLIARLGAAADAAIPPLADASETKPAEQRTDFAETPDNGTAARLALLEAEIADLTERVTVGPATDDVSVEAPDDALPETSPDDTTTEAFAWTSAGDVSDSDDDEDAELTIVGADGAPVAPITRDGRQAPRIFRDDSVPTDDEEAEVEIRGTNAAPPDGRGTDRPAAVRAGARSKPGMSKTSARGKWRLFGGSD